METDTTMDTKDSATHAATATTTHDIIANAADNEDEMPLLFMDQLPANFTQNAQLAALATFMADSDDDAADEDQNGASEAGNGSKQRRQRHHKVNRLKRRQEPYAKPVPSGKMRTNTKKRDETKCSDTKELQLFLSLFHVS